MHKRSSCSQSEIADSLGIGRLRRSWLAAVAAAAVTASLVYPVPAAADTQLTATFSNMPESHDGSAFTFNLTIDPQPSLSYKTLIDHAFTVVNGAIANAVRVDNRLNNARRDSDWTITVQPTLNSGQPVGNITITLPATTQCSDQGAICTSGNLRLTSVPDTATVSLPGTSPPTSSTVPPTTSSTSPPTSSTVAPPPPTSSTVPPPPSSSTVPPTSSTVPTTQLTAEFSDVPDSHNGSRFTFYVTFAPEPDLSYKTLRDHAFTVVGGTVVKASRAKGSKRSNTRWRMMIVPDLDSNVTASREVSVTLPSTTSCSDSGAICTSDNQMLSNRNEVTIPVSEDLPQPPSKPQSVTATPGPDIGEITVAWTEATTGTESGAAVRGYRVQYDCSGDTVTALRSRTERSFKITGLGRSQSCRINVAARNRGGYGLAAWAGGSDSTHHPPLNPPEAPASVTVAPVDANDDSQRTTVSWTAPASGPAPTSYQIAYWDIDEERFQYVAHASTTDLEAVIEVPAADLRTVAVRGHLGGVAYQDRGVWGSWATGWHSSAKPSKLDKMTQSATLSLSLAHSDDGTAGMPIDLSGITGSQCTNISGVYVNTENNRAWFADDCGRSVHAFDIGEDGALTRDADTTLTEREMYPAGAGFGSRSRTPASLWSDGETLWVVEREMGLLLPYQLSDGAFLSDQRLLMAPLGTNAAPAAAWSDGDTVWVADDVYSGRIFAADLSHGTSSTRAQEVFVPSAFDSCYIPEHPRQSDVEDATCTTGTAIDDAINVTYDEVQGLHSDGRWLWVAVDYNAISQYDPAYDSSEDRDGMASELLAFNLLTGERAESRDIALPDYMTRLVGMWSDGDKLWVTHGATARLYTFDIPSA